jgi:hypothetical protein
MRTIDFLAGTPIEQASRLLVENAPARGVFNEIPLRARYATTRPEDIVRHYHWRLELRSITYAHSPRGRKMAAEQEADRASKQATVDACLSALPALDFADADAVVSWVERIADAADRIGVLYDRAAVVETFTAAGWPPGVNCGEDFDESDQRNYAGWIVGQWLASGYPNVGMFAEKWRERFVSKAAQ